MYTYRVFISYSHKDSGLMETVKKHLEENLGCQAIVDRWDLEEGMPFDERIMECIEQAHVFLPILTEDASSKLWTHQEIGYAKGRDVPILPLAVGGLPEGLVRTLQAVKVNGDLSDLEERLTRSVLVNVIDPVSFPKLPGFECARDYEERTQALVCYARRAARLGYGRVRLLGAFTSFAIPKKDHTHSIWDRREGKHKTSSHARKWFQRERMILQEHAENAGCDLIIKPSIKNDRHDQLGWDTRLRVLREALEEIRKKVGDEIRVVISDVEMVENQVIVGDSFLAEAIVPLTGGRFRNTLFTRHGPTVLERIKEFDVRMQSLLAEAGLDGRSSVDVAIEEIERLRHEDSTARKRKLVQGSADLT